MRPWEQFIAKTNADKNVLESYIKMRVSLQHFGVEQWQLEKGYRIPGTIYTLRAETISNRMHLVNELSKYGLLSDNNDIVLLGKYLEDKLKKIDEEYPLQKGEKPDYIDDED